MESISGEREFRMIGQRAIFDRDAARRKLSQLLMVTSKSQIGMRLLACDSFGGENFPAAACNYD